MDVIKYTVGGKVRFATPAPEYLQKAGVTIHTIAEKLEKDVGTTYEIIADRDKPAPDQAEILAERRGGMVVSRFQAKAALSAAGLLDRAEELVAGADPITQLAWAEVIEFRRNSPTILALQGAMGLTDAQLDALFLAASAIEA
jgi:hypothetical protein